MLKLNIAILVLTHCVFAAPILVVGSGPAGMSVVQTLTNADYEVILVDKVPYVGGNIAHGYFYTKDPNHYFSQFRVISQRRNVHFFGGVTVGEAGDLSLTDLSTLKLAAVVFANGAAPRTLEHAITANQVFYYYNGHPLYPNPPAIGRRVAVIGSGSSSYDVTKYLLLQNRGTQFFQLNRRGPGQYGRKSETHFANIFGALDRPDYLNELHRIAPALQSVGEDMEQYVHDYYNYSRSPFAFPENAGSVHILHLVTPARVLTDSNRKVTGIELERNRLVLENESVSSVGTDERFVLEVDTVITAMGGVADSETGLPIENGFVRTVSTEDRLITRDTQVRNPDQYFKTRTLEHYLVDFSQSPSQPPFPVFVVGWARLPGIGATEELDRFSNFPDGRRLGELLVDYLARTHSSRNRSPQVLDGLTSFLNNRGCKWVMRAMSRPEKRPDL